MVHLRLFLVGAFLVFSFGGVGLGHPHLENGSHLHSEHESHPAHGAHPEHVKGHGHGLTCKKAKLAQSWAKLAQS